MTQTDPQTNAAFPDGHFYSPVVDPVELAAQADCLWPVEPPQILGIDFNDTMHEHILGTAFPRYIAAYDYPEYLGETPELVTFFTANSEFGWLDSRALFVLLREWQPKRMIEVGSGFSSLLTADVNRRFLDSSLDFRCIEPFPRAFLQKPIVGITELMQEKVQDVPLTTFARLRAGDILFIDSSHVAKTGSDVNYLYFEVLPRLAAGVRVHIHDVFLPHEYKMDWVLDENRSWNEQYLVRALLMYSTAFRVLFSCSYASSRFPDLLSAATQLPGGPVLSGGSLWIERVGGGTPSVPGPNR